MKRRRWRLTTALLAAAPSAPWAAFCLYRRDDEPDMPAEKMLECPVCKHVAPQSGLRAECRDCEVERAYFRWAGMMQCLRPWLRQFALVCGCVPRLRFLAGLPPRWALVGFGLCNDAEDRDSAPRGIWNLDAEDGFADLDAEVFESGVTFRHTDGRTGGGMHNLHTPIPSASRKRLREEITYYEQTNELHPRAISEM